MTFCTISFMVGKIVVHCIFVWTLYWIQHKLETFTRPVVWGSWILSSFHQYAWISSMYFESYWHIIIFWLIRQKRRNPLHKLCGCIPDALSCQTGHVTLVINTGTTILVPYLEVRLDYMTGYQVSSLNNGHQGNLSHSAIFIALQNQKLHCLLLLYFLRNHVGWR